jgi:hypothetical protein
MKKIIIIMLIACGISFQSFASKSNLGKEKIATHLLKKHAKLQATSSVHLSGTMTSSCGEVWDFTYDCYSDCSLSGVLSNLADMQAGINAACGTSTTSLSFSW